MQRKKNNNKEAKLMQIMRKYASKAHMMTMNYWHHRFKEDIFHY